MPAKWFKNAVIYGVDIPTYQDGDGDGIGDFRGLTSRLEYIADLGVDCLWLLPFYPSPRRDNGYDVSNYYGIDPKFGSIDDFREFMREADAHGIRVMIDLVVQHTSDRHPWFEAAKSDRHSSYRDYYIWSDTLPTEPEESRFPEAESGVWRYDPISSSYYHHSFYHFQPDLNFANERVRDEVFRIVDFWLSFGVSGFRVDAAHLLIGRKGLPGTEVPEPDKYWCQIRQFLNRRDSEVVLFAEADTDKVEIPKYVNGGEGIHMLLSFWTNRTIMHALATQQAEPLNNTLGDLPTMPEGSQYVNFLRNLDELSVERLSSVEQQQVFQAFGRSKRMQVYGRGIRRRLAPMLGGDLARLKLAYSLLFGMPGVPMFVYGDEIGMGDNLDLAERDSVRTPMQWTAEQDNAGFSHANSSYILHRMVQDPRYNYERVNVRDQLADQDSLLLFIRRLIRVRKRCRLIGSQDFAPIRTDQPHVVALSYANRSKLIMLNNLSGKSTNVQLSKKGELHGLQEIFADSRYARIHNHHIKLGPYGFRWFYHED
jgi:maltose alpha-D-glucosyltransferase/alpha-amylase